MKSVASRKSGLARSLAARKGREAGGFTLIELLTVIAIISLLISMLLPSLSRAREQAKSVRCLATLKEFGNALAAYLNVNKDRLPPAMWNPDPRLLEQPVNVDFGWTELLWTFVYRNDVRVPESFPVQRNVRGEEAWGAYFVCHTAADGLHSGHYRVYLPAWAQGSYAIQSDGRYGYNTRAEPRHGAMIEDIYQLLPIIADANEYSERGDNLGLDDCSYIDAGEANIAGSNGRNGNRISDRHYGGANYLFPDFHAESERKLRERLARDWDLNGVVDIDGG